MGLSRRDGRAPFAARHLLRPARVLDAGCGTGLVGAGLHARGWDDLTGADISAGMLAKARARGIYREFARCDLCELSFEERRFDAVVCIAVLTYAPSIERLFRSFERVLGPAGLVVFSHRVDLEADCGFGEAMASRLRDGAWTELEVTGPMPYYPLKADYADIITVRYHAYRVRESAAKASADCGRPSRHRRGGVREIFKCLISLYYVCGILADLLTIPLLWEIL